MIKSTDASTVQLFRARFMLDSSMWAMTFMQSFPWYRPLHSYCTLCDTWKRKKDDISFSFIPRSLVLSMDFTSPTSLKDESVTIRNSGDYYLPYRNVNFCGLKHRCNAYKRIVSNGHWLVVASISWHISLKWIE